MFSVGAIHPFCSPLAPPSNRNRSFGLRAFTPLIPLCPSPKTEKQNQILFKSDLLSQIKRKTCTSYNTAYLVTAFYKSLHPYLPPLHYGKHQICRNALVLRQNSSKLSDICRLFSSKCNCVLEIKLIKAVFSN